MWLFANLITITFHLQTRMCYFTEMICVLHDDDKTKDDTTKIIPFNKESLEKCQSTLKIRCKAGLKYSSKTIPDDVNNTHGYHIACYRSLLHSHLNTEMKQLLTIRFQTQALLILIPL